MSEKQEPYAPPKAAVRDVGEGRPRPITGVVVGALVDLGGTMAASIALSVIYSLVLAGRGLSPEQIAETLTNIPVDSGFSLATMAVGLLFSVLGGYVCAGYAGTRLFKSGAVLAAIVCLAGLLVSAPEYSAGTSVVLLAVTAAAVMGGVWLRSRRQAVPASADRADPEIR